MTHQSVENRHHLFHELQRLERLLEAPLVPGESEPRSKNLRSAVEEVRDAFLDHARRDQPRALNEIAEVDPGLLHRVDRMKREADDLIDCWVEASATADALCENAIGHPDEAGFRERFDQYADEALKLVIRTRSHEAAVRTWTTEAFQRDRGEPG